MAIGSLSAGVGIGNAGTGAICAPGPALGRPIAQNGTSSCFGGSAGGGVVCWAMAGHATSARPVTATISRAIRRVVEAPIMAILPLGPLDPGCCGVLLQRTRTVRPFAGAMLTPRPDHVKTQRGTVGC